MTDLAYGGPVPFTSSLPAYLSPSRLADLRACPRRFQHGSIDRIRQPATYATTKGRAVHLVLERLFALPAAERTRTAALAMVDDAVAEILTDEVRNDLSLTDDARDTLTDECAHITSLYFELEDPRTVASEGVELRLTATVEGVPMLGILDRLDRVGDELVIVDYKTGALPNRNYDAQTFANTELYAALCEAAIGQRPLAIRLLYVAQGQAIERAVTDPVVRARTATAAEAWSRAQQYFADGEFPATPSKNTCRFCAYRDLCRSNGVPVPA